MCLCTLCITSATALLENRKFFTRKLILYSFRRKYKQRNLKQYEHKPKYKGTLTTVFGKLISRLFSYVSVQRSTGFVSPEEQSALVCLLIQTSTSFHG